MILQGVHNHSFVKTVVFTFVLATLFIAQCASASVHLSDYVEGPVIVEPDCECVDIALGSYTSSGSQKSLGEDCEKEPDSSVVLPIASINPAGSVIEQEVSNAPPDWSVLTFSWSVNLARSHL